MQCCSRSTLGVIIGGLNIFGFTVLIIYIITILCAFNDLSEDDKLENNDILTTSVTLLYFVLICSVFSLITSVFLVVGIVKQRHTFMKPWIYGAEIAIVFYILRLIIELFGGFSTETSFANILAHLVVGLLALGLQILILYLIYTLYTDIRDASNAQEQRGLNTVPQNPPSYGEMEKGVEMYN